MERHAYLIMAHDKFEQLKFLLSLLDDNRNDIYLHIDKKAVSVDIDELCSPIKQSKIVVIKRNRVSWGSYSTILTEMDLIKTALNSGVYTYLHLLSGTCLPIKSQDYIHEFFKNNQESIFIDYASKDKNLLQRERLKFYLLGQDFRGCKKNWLYKVQNNLISLQRKVGVNRLKDINQETINSGSQWFSITSDFATWVAKQDKFVRHYFKHTICGDEMFMQTLLAMSPYSNRHVNDSLRYVIWEGGWHPRWLEIKDKDALVCTSALFARKFDLEKEPQMKEVILELLSNTRQPIE